MSDKPREMTDYNTFLTKLNVLIRLKGETHISLTAKCDASRPTINRFLNGRNDIRSKNLIKILDVLGIDVESLIDRQVGTTPSECRSSGDDLQEEG